MFRNTPARLFHVFLVSACCFFPGLPGSRVQAQVNLALHRAAWHSAAANFNQTAHLVTDGNELTSWKSNNGNSAWLYVDLGEISEISSVQILWGEVPPARFELQTAISGKPDSPEGWSSKARKTAAAGSSDRYPLNVRARYLRILMAQKPDSAVEIRELKVFGNQPFRGTIGSHSAMIDGNPGSLNGRHWKIRRSTEVQGDAASVSSAGCDVTGWLDASVPGTVLASYVEAGAVPDPLYADNQLQISEWYFNADFWYRREFIVPESYRDRNIRLNFKGINWKAEVYVNGHFAGRIDGAFTRASFDITGLVNPGEQSVVAVLIKINDHPGEATLQHLNDPDGNGGIIGRDSPTYVSSIGWNWLPTIRGRNTGITDDVYISASGRIELKDPFLTTTLNLPDTTEASIGLSLDLVNPSKEVLDATLQLSCHYFSTGVRITGLQPGEVRQIQLNEDNLPELRIHHPHLWWPNGYGKQQLDTLTIVCTEGDDVSDSLRIPFGIRQIEYRYVNSSLFLHVNGYPLLIRGGNWGLPEALLRCDAAKYDLLVRMHKDMNLNMIRNWVGQTSNDAFYDACDRHGILIFDDFWLANPVDGPDPADESMFIRNAADKIRRFRNHPALALWAGRNEGFPPASLDSAMRDLTSQLDCTRHYIAHSASSPVTGLGPYENKDPEWYFSNRGATFHTEQGIVCVPTLESMCAMLPQQSRWPVNDLWGLHDWTQPRVQRYTDDMIYRYGAPESLEDFCLKAQMLNLEGPKAMMEAWQSKRGPGVLVWMTHPAWPSLICQTYDYYLQPSAAYFALKRGSEPVHVFLNPLNHSVQISNNTIHQLRAITAKAEVYSISGNKISEKSFHTEVNASSTKDCFSVDVPSPTTGIMFVKLSLKDEEDKLLSDNFYWLSPDSLNYRELNRLPGVQLKATASIDKIRNKDCIVMKITNTTEKIALMTELVAADEARGERLLPVFLSDNFFSLVPGESQTVTITPENGLPDRMLITIRGWNIAEQHITLIKAD